MDYPKYQYSKMLNGDQIVVRSEDKKEFEEMVEYAMEFYKVQPSPVMETPPKINVSVDDFDKSHICPAHGIQMVSRISKKTNEPYWSHRSSEGELCFGKGYKPKK